MRLNIGVIGVGHLGKYHLEKLISRDDINFVGFFEQDIARRKFIYKEFDVTAFNKIEE